MAAKGHRRVGVITCVASVAAAGALVGCSPGGSQESSAQPSPSSVTRSATAAGAPYVGYPDAIVVLVTPGRQGTVRTPRCRSGSRLGPTRG
jgi:hypothetical protein